MSENEPRQTNRIGQFLIEHEVLTEEQVERILEEQKRCGRPFGDLAERLFAVDPTAVERAWIEQYVHFSGAVDLDRQRVEKQVLRTINRRQAWQFRMAPLRREHDDLIAATSRQHLRRAVNFAWRSFDEPIHFLIARRPQLEQFLMQHYPWPSALNLPAAG